MLRSLVGSEMCIRDSYSAGSTRRQKEQVLQKSQRRPGQLQKFSEPAQRFVQVSQLLRCKGEQVRPPLQPIGKLNSPPSRPSSADSKVHAATAMSFPTNAGLLFLKDEISKDSFLVDTGATLSIVPHNSNASPSGPIPNGANGKPIPTWGFISKVVQFQCALSHIPFCKPPWQAPSWALNF